jgi:hypothetical protein
MLYLSALLFFILPIRHLPLIIYSIKLAQRIFMLFSRVLNVTWRRIGWRRRVFVCYVYRCRLIPLTSCQLLAASFHYTRFAQSI